MGNTNLTISYNFLFQNFYPTLRNFNPIKATLAQKIFNQARCEKIFIKRENFLLCHSREQILMSLYSFLSSFRCMSLTQTWNDSFSRKNFLNHRVSFFFSSSATSSLIFCFFFTLERCYSNLSICSCGIFVTSFVIQRLFVHY